MSDPLEMFLSVRRRLARRIRLLRNDKGYTQEKLAQNAGLASRHLQKIEAAEINVTLESLVKIAVALDTDVIQLFAEDSKLKEL